MNYIAVCIEQLDLAAEQLRTATTSSDRFALILTDNIVELMIHLQCQEEVRHSQRIFNSRPKYCSHKRKEVLGRYFAPKVNFCLQLGKLDSDEVNFILKAHHYRNVLYHAGIRHDQIMHELAWQYHQLACKLFGRLRLVSFGWSAQAKVSSLVTRYVEGGDEAYATVHGQLPKIANMLASAKPASTKVFAQELSAYLTHRVSELEGSLEFLAADNPNGMTEAEIIEHVQLYNHIYGDESVYLDQVEKCKNPSDLDSLMYKVKQNWKAPISKSQLTRWKRQAMALTTESHTTKALTAFYKLDEEMSDFEGLIHDAAVTMAVDLDI